LTSIRRLPIVAFPKLVLSFPSSEGFCEFPCDEDEPDEGCCDDTGEDESDEGACDDIEEDESDEGACDDIWEDDEPDETACARTSRCEEDALPAWFCMAKAATPATTITAAPIMKTLFLILLCLRIAILPFKLL